MDKFSVIFLHKKGADVTYREVFSMAVERVVEHVEKGQVWGLAMQLNQFHKEKCW